MEPIVNKEAVDNRVCVVIGASHAAAQLVMGVLRHGWQGAVVVVGEEPFLPYHRPPLSKGYLAEDKGADGILIRSQAAYEKADIRFKLGVRVIEIDREKRLVKLDNGEDVYYDKLALTVGARPRKINLPGFDKEGVFYLRNINDVDRIRGHIKPGGHAVIIGGGYIGLETAASLKKIGMTVTILEEQSRVLARVTAEEVSDFYQRVHREEGVEIVTNVKVENLEGNRWVESVNCAGGQSFNADVVIVGIGVLPNIELAKEAGLEVGNGIVVDEFSRTSDLDIVAAGDCSWHYNPIFQRHMRLESVQNANDQASVAAATICGKYQPYKSLPWFWSDQYDLKLQIAGLSEGYNNVIIRGDINSGRSFAAFYLLNDQLLAVHAVNKPQEFMLGKRIISNSLDINVTSLRDENIPLTALIKN